MVAVISGIVCGETPRPSGARAAFKDAGQAERHLLAALGMKRRPVVDKSKVEIPAAMLELYRMQMSYEFDTTALPLPGHHVKSANTARTYLHRGKFEFSVRQVGFIDVLSKIPHDMMVWYHNMMHLTYLNIDIWFFHKRHWKPRISFH